MQFYKYLTFIFLGSILFTACKSKDSRKFKLTTSKIVVLGKDATINLQQTEGTPVDSVKLYINGKPFKTSTGSFTVKSTDIGVGKHAVTGLFFYPGKVKKANSSIEVLANIKPEVYTYKIVNTYPHDKDAFTQGLEYKDGFLYETTGRHGQSSLRKVEIKTGKVLEKQNLNKKYFGEGMTIFNDTVYWLTWKHRKGFKYDLNSFKQVGEFNYGKSFEGWGLTHNATELIKSDGTNKIWFLDPETQQEKRAIQVYTNKRPVKDLNEIEYIDGKIYANKWQQNAIVIINPENGVVEGIADLSGLKKEVLKTQKNLDASDDVLNGIAYDAKNKRLFVTGKLWDKLFEIELIKK